MEDFQRVEDGDSGVAVSRRLPPPLFTQAAFRYPFHFLSFFFSLPIFSQLSSYLSFSFPCFAIFLLEAYPPFFSIFQFLSHMFLTLSPIFHFSLSLFLNLPPIFFPLQYFPQYSSHLSFLFHFFLILPPILPHLSLLINQHSSVRQSMGGRRAKREV